GEVPARRPPRRAAAPRGRRARACAGRSQGTAARAAGLDPGALRGPPRLRGTAGPGGLGRARRARRPDVGADLHVPGATRARPRRARGGPRDEVAARAGGGVPRLPAHRQPALHGALRAGRAAHARSRGHRGPPAQALPGGSGGRMSALAPPFPARAPVRDDKWLVTLAISFGALMATIDL